MTKLRVVSPPSFLADLFEGPIGKTLNCIQLPPANGMTTASRLFNTPAARNEDCSSPCRIGKDATITECGGRRFGALPRPSVTPGETPRMTRRRSRVHSRSGPVRKWPPCCLGGFVWLTELLESIRPNLTEEQKKEWLDACRELQRPANIRTWRDIRGARPWNAPASCWKPLEVRGLRLDSPL